MKNNNKLKENIEYYFNHIIHIMSIENNRTYQLVYLIRLSTKYSSISLNIC